MFNPNVVIKNIVEKNQLNTLLFFIGRVYLAYIFLVAGWGKITAYHSTLDYMETMGVSGLLLPLTIFVEFGGGLALLFGLQIRLAALGLVIFSLTTAFFFHGTADEAINFMKNIAISGGLIFVMLSGAGKFSLDYWIEKK